MNIVKKTFLALSLCAFVAMLATGCSSLPKAIKAASESNRTIHVKVTSIYGVAEISATNPQSNQNATVSEAGAVSVMSNQIR